MKWRMPDQEVDQKALREVEQKDCQVRKFNREDAIEYRS